MQDRFSPLRVNAASRLGWHGAESVYSFTQDKVAAQRLTLFSQELQRVQDRFSPLRVNAASRLGWCSKGLNVRAEQAGRQPTPSAASAPPELGAFIPPQHGAAMITAPPGVRSSPAGECHVTFGVARGWECLFLHTGQGGGAALVTLQPGAAMGAGSLQPPAGECRVLFGVAR